MITVIGIAFHETVTSSIAVPLSSAFFPEGFCPAAFGKEAENPALQSPFPHRYVTFCWINIPDLSFFIPKNPPKSGPLLGRIFCSCSSGGTKPAGLAELRLKTEADDHATLIVGIVVVVVVAVAVHVVEIVGVVIARGPQPPPGGAGLSVPAPHT